MATMKDGQNGGPERTSDQGRKAASGGEGEIQKVANAEGGGNRQDSASRGGGSSRSIVTKGKAEGAGKKLPARRK